MKDRFSPNLEPDAQILRQQIAELTEVNVALQVELVGCQQAEEVLRVEVAQTYQDITKFKRAEQLARRQTTALIHTLEKLTTNSELNKFLGQVLIAITEQLDTPLSALWLLDQAKENAWLHMMCHEGQILTGEQQLGHPNAGMPDSIADSGAWHAVYSARRPVIHDNIANNPIFRATQREWLLAHEIKALLSVPLLLGSEVIGKLTLSLKRGSFTAEDVELTQALAYQVTLAVQLTRLAEQGRQTAVLEEHNRVAQERAVELEQANEALQAEIAERKRTEQVSRGQTEALLKTLTVLAAEPVLDNFLGYVLQAIVEQLGSRSGGIWLYNQIHDNTVFHINYESGQIQLVAMNSLSVALSQNVLRQWDNEYMSLLREKKILLHDERDFAESPAYAPYRTDYAQRGIKTILIVSLFSGETFLGYLTIRSTQRRDYKPEELDLARVLAYQASLAIQLTRLAAQAQQSAVLEERNRMAREIHDNLAQGFTGVVVQLEGAENVLIKAPEKARAHIDLARQLARESLLEARRSVRALRPQALEAGNLAFALARLAERMSEDTPVQVSFQVRGTSILLPPDMESGLLRIAQEALTNVLKHAYATSVWLELIYEPEEIWLSVQDNGQGFDLKKQHNIKNGKGEISRGGFGLISMRERTERIGGRLTLNSCLGQGTNVSVAVPVRLKTLPCDH
jgi:signal transduction histidine kinase